MTSPDVPEGMDMKIESEETDVGLSSVTITAVSEQAQIDLAMEYPRIVKLLSRKWTIVSGNKVVMRNGKVAWTYNKSDAESWALSIGGTVISCDELRSRAD